MREERVVGQCLYRSWKRGKGNVGRVKWGFCGKDGVSGRGGHRSASDGFRVKIPNPR